MSALRRAILETARAWLGTAFAHQGRVRGVGVDCVGLAVSIGHELGLFAGDRTDYSGLPDGVTLQRELGAVLECIDGADAQPGDVLVFWRSPKTRHAQHVGILGEAGTLIHAHQTAGRVVETPLGVWAERITCAFRYPGVTDWEGT